VWVPCFGFCEQNLHPIIFVTMLQNCYILKKYND